MKPSKRYWDLNNQAHHLLRGGIDKTGRGWLLWWDGGTEREWCCNLDDVENTIARVAKERGIKKED